MVERGLDQTIVLVVEADLEKYLFRERFTMTLPTIIEQPLMELGLAATYSVDASALVIILQGEEYYDSSESPRSKAYCREFPTDEPMAEDSVVFTCCFWPKTLRV